MEKIVSNFQKYFVTKYIEEHYDDFYCDKAYYHILTNELLQHIDTHLYPGNDGDAFAVYKNDIGKYIHISVFGEPVSKEDLFEMKWPESKESIEATYFQSEMNCLELIGGHGSDMIGKYGDVVSHNKLMDIMMLSGLQEMNKKTK